MRITNFHNEDVFTGKVTSKGFNTASHPGDLRANRSDSERHLVRDVPVVVEAPFL